MGHARLEQFRDAEKEATSALGVQPGHKKALFRRGAARRRLGAWSLARADLSAVLEIDPNLKEAKRELIALKTDEAAAQEAAKKAFGGAFARAGASLYGDKEVGAQNKNLVISANYHVLRLTILSDTTPLTPVTSGHFRAKRRLGRRNGEWTRPPRP